MVSTLVLGVGLVLAVPGDEGPPPSTDQSAYEAAKAKAGRDPQAHIRLALWCERHGLPAERLKHLALAVLTDPQNATARGLMGLVEYGGKWSKPDEVNARVKTDADLSAKLAEYNARRERMANTADGHWNLAMWCEEAGLRPEARAHLTEVTRLEPGREAAWKRLGFKKQGRRWVTPDQLAAERAESEAQRKANLHWKPLLEKWRSMLARKSQRAEAESNLATLTDPKAVPSVWVVFAASNDAVNQSRAVQLLGQIDSPNASRALALLAIRSASSEVRRAATETLTRRDRREFLDVLIAAIRDPLKYEVRPVGGPGSPGALFVEGKQFNVQRLYSPPPAFPSGLPNGMITYDANGLPVLVTYAGTASMTGSPDQLAAALGFTSNPQGAAAVAASVGNNLGPAAKPLQQALNGAAQGSAAGLSTFEQGQFRTLTREVDLQIPIGQMMIEAEKGAAVARQQLQSDVNTVDAYNKDTHQHNDRILTVLRQATGQELGENQQAWRKWWINEQGYATPKTEARPLPTVVQNVPLNFTPAPLSPSLVVGSQFSLSHSCFGAGTSVRTLTGSKAIEQVHVGDRILTQDGVSGLLSYQPVVAVFHNKPNQTLRVQLGDDTIVVTGIHRFWKAGQGWVMARELKPGDVVRVLGGTARVDGVDSDTVQPVFNLQVAEGQSFFVGNSGALVHDNSIVNPVSAPFDAPDAKPAGAHATVARTE
jgi:hypothetical protein